MAKSRNTNGHGQATVIKRTKVEKSYSNPVEVDGEVINVVSSCKLFGGMMVEDGRIVGDCSNCKESGEVQFYCGASTYPELLIPVDGALLGGGKKSKKSKAPKAPGEYKKHGGNGKNLGVKRTAGFGAWGHTIGGSGCRIDEAIGAGCYTKAEIAEIAGTPEARVSGHIYHLRKEHGFNPKKNAEGKWYFAEV